MRGHEKRLGSLIPKYSHFGQPRRGEIQIVMWVREEEFRLVADMKTEEEKAAIWLRREEQVMRDLSWTISILVLYPIKSDS